MIRVIESMNPTAKVFPCTEAQVDPLRIVGSIHGVGAADFGVLDEHQKLVESIDHDHSHSHGEHDAHDHSHSHSHDDDHSHSSSSACMSTDPTHVHDENCGHSHDHNHDTTTAEKR